MNYQKRSISLAVSLLVGLSGNVQAQLEEVVVTAQKRAENIQDVPIAISALSQDALDAKGITSVADIGNSSPNVTLDSTAPFSGSSSILIGYIRGIGQNDFAFNLDPGVGVYLDGVYLARNIGANTDLLDLERIEVLKGPQGTLFGRNTIGGAINIVTRAPSSTFGFKFETTVGRFDRRDVRASIDLPLIDDVLLSTVSVAIKKRDGYQKRIPFPGAENYVTHDFGQFLVTGDNRSSESGGEDQQIFRGKLAWRAHDSLNVTLAADYMETNEQATPATLLAVNQTGTFVPIYNTCINTPAAVLAASPLAGICGPRGNPSSPAGVQPGLAGVNVDADPTNNRLPYDNRFVTGDPDKSYAGGNNFSYIRSKGLAATVEYDLTDSMSLTSITAYRNLDATFGVDIGGAPFTALDPSFHDDESQFSQELQVTGLTLNDKLDYVVGAYYFREWGLHTDAVPFLAGLAQIYSPDNRYDTKAYALFTHNNYELTDKWGLTVGARYTEEDKSFTGAQRDENLTGVKLGVPLSVYPDPNDLTRLYPLAGAKAKFYNFSYRLGVNYKFDEDTLGYLSASTGFKSGGWTTRLQLPIGRDTEAPGFGPEKAKTYEVGLKTTLWDRRLRLNTAAFYTDYSDIQVTIQQGTSPVFVNGGDGRIRGLELEANINPIDELLIDASVGYIEAEYTKLSPNVQGITKNSDFVNTPTWSTQLGIAYTVKLGEFGSIIPRVDYSYRSDTANDAENTQLLRSGEVSTVNVSVLYKTLSDHHQIQVGVQNATDERYLVSGYVNDTSIVSGTYSRPREWYATYRYKY